MKNKICSVDGCKNNVRSRNLCNKHYLRLWYKKDFEENNIDQSRYNRKCSIDLCNKKHFAKGYCSKHYNNFKRHGDPKKTVTERHGLTHVPEYQVWRGIKRRCNDPTHKDYKNYGAKGITISDEWVNSFKTFYSDMGQRPFNKAQIDRKKNNLGYSKENCHWVTCTANNRNKSTTTLTMEDVRDIRAMYSKGNIMYKEIAEIFGICGAHVGSIIRNENWKEGENQ